MCYPHRWNLSFILSLTCMIHPEHKVETSASLTVHFFHIPVSYCIFYLPFMEAWLILNIFHTTVYWFLKNLENTVNVFSLILGHFALNSVILVIAGLLISLASSRVIHLALTIALLKINQLLWEKGVYVLLR